MQTKTAQNCSQPAATSPLPQHIKAEQANFLNFSAPNTHCSKQTMLCSNFVSIGARVTAVRSSSTLSPPAACSSLKASQNHQPRKKGQPTCSEKSIHRISKSLSKRLLSLSSSQITDDEEIFMVQKSIESRKQRTRRGSGVMSKSDVHDFLKESSIRYRPATRLTTATSVESAASDLIDDVQINGLIDMAQVNLADNTDQQNADDEQESQIGAQPPRKRGLLRKLSSALQRKPMTRYGSFDGHRDSLEIVRRQVKTDGTAYRPRVPHPILSDLDDNNVDNEESSKNNVVIAEVAFQHPTAAIVQTSAGESTKEKRREDIEEEKEEVRIRDIASQEDATAVTVHQRLRDDGHHQKISADSNPTPLPPLLQNDKVGFARSA